MNKSKLLLLLRFLKRYLPCICLFLFLHGSVARAFVIPSLSMHPTLKVGHRLVVNQLSYGVRVIGFRTTPFVHSNPKRGDIVVFTRPDDLSTPTNESDIYIIKRVLALPVKRFSRGVEKSPNPNSSSPGSRAHPMVLPRRIRAARISSGTFRT